MYRSVTLYALRHHLFNADGTVREQELRRQMEHISMVMAWAVNAVRESRKIRMMTGSMAYGLM